MQILVFGFTLDDKRLHKNALTFYYDLRKGLESQAEELGLSLRIDFSGRLDSQKIKEARRADGILAVNPPRLASLQARWNLLEKSKPCVSLGSESLFAEGNYVGTDDAGAVGLLVDHLVSEGFRKIGFFSVANEGYTLRRYEGYLAALQKHRLAPKQAWVNAFQLGAKKLIPAWEKIIKKRKHWSETALEREGRKTFRHYLRQPNPPEAVIFETDRLAKYGFEILSGMGRRVPEDMALTGFDDMQIEMEPQGYNILTTIRQDFYELGRSGVRLLFEILKGKRSARNQRIYFPGTLVVRKTSLKKSFDHPASSEGGFKKTTTEFIRRRFGEDRLAKRLADFHLLSPEYFLIRFKKEFGETFTAHLAGVRMEKAAFLLANTRRSVTQILHEVGFHNHQAFNRVFKKKFRLSPLQFRFKKAMMRGANLS